MFHYLAGHDSGNWGGGDTEDLAEHTVERTAGRTEAGDAIDEGEGRAVTVENLITLRQIRPRHLFAIFRLDAPGLVPGGSHVTLLVHRVEEVILIDAKLHHIDILSALRLTAHAYEFAGLTHHR